MPQIEEQNYSEIAAKAKEEVEEYNKDFLRHQMREIMHLDPICPTDDQVFIKELSARMTRLTFLENQLEDQAVMLNCKKDDVMVEMVTAEKMRSELETARKELEEERERNRRKLLDFENDVQRNAQLVTALQGNYERLIEELDAIKDQTKRTGFWGKLVESRTGKGEAEEKKEEIAPEKVNLLESEE